MPLRRAFLCLLVTLSLAVLGGGSALAQGAWGNYDDEPVGSGTADDDGGAWGAGTGQAGDAQAGGTCEGACLHYLSCAGAADPAAFQQCLVACAQLGLTPQQLAAFQAADCATTLATVQQLEGGGSGGSGGGSGGGSNCQGCVRDGDSCVWFSQSDWGQAGPYSGAVITCDPSCCR